MYSYIPHNEEITYMNEGAAQKLRIHGQYVQFRTIEHGFSEMRTRSRGAFSKTRRFRGTFLPSGPDYMSVNRPEKEFLV